MLLLPDVPQKSKTRNVSGTPFVPTLPLHAGVSGVRWQRIPGSGKAEEQDFFLLSIAIKFSVTPSPSLLLSFTDCLPGSCMGRDLQE